MTGREKIEAAFSVEGTPEFAAVIPYEDVYVRDRWDELTDMPWWYAYDPNPETQVRWRSKIIDALAQDWFILPLGASHEEVRSVRIEERPDGVFRIDERTGANLRLERLRIGGWNPYGDVESRSPTYLAQSPDEIDNILPPCSVPDVDEIVWNGQDTLAKALLEKFGSRLCPVWLVSSPLWSCYGLWGFEGMMLMIAERPEIVRYACQRYLEYGIRSIREAASLGASVIWIEECLMDQISPETFASLNLPYLAVLVEEAHSYGLRSIYYFCGNPADRWQHILSVGADALALEESKKGFNVDIEEIAEILRGRCVLLGNLDAIGVLQNGSEERLRAEIKRQIAAGRKNNNRFIMSIGSPVTPYTPIERLRLYCNLVREFGR
jgi:hypothetical protein